MPLHEAWLPVMMFKGTGVAQTDDLPSTAVEALEWCVRPWFQVTNQYFIYLGSSYIHGLPPSVTESQTGWRGFILLIKHLYPVSCSIHRASSSQTRVDPPAGARAESCGQEPEASRIAPAQVGTGSCWPVALMAAFRTCGDGSEVPCRSPYRGVWRFLSPGLVCISWQAQDHTIV